MGLACGWRFSGDKILFRPAALNIKESAGSAGFLRFRWCPQHSGSTVLGIDEPLPPVRALVDELSARR
jgi:hypothetical protein